MIRINGQPMLTAAQMRAAELASGVPLAELMRRAGEGVATAVARLGAGAEVLVLCGPGNNGGDGYIAATALARMGLPVRVAASAAPATDLARDAAGHWLGPVEHIANASPASMIVDALFGTGLTRPLEDAVAARLSSLAHAARLVVAVDLPSGVASDDGAVLSEPPSAHVTLALGALKPAHLLQPAARHCGAIRLLDIGIAATSQVAALARPVLPEPGPDSHKFNRGMVAVVGGAMRGAGEAAANAAMRSGAGYVVHLGDGDGPPHALVRRPWSADALADKRIGCVVIGPGLGRDDAARAKLEAALATGHRLVIDGDALHLIDPDRLADRKSDAVLTPHGGEFAALFGEAQGSKIDRARAAAARANCIIAFKGTDTVIAAPDGRAIVAGDGNDWLSTAGTGDVLAGTVAAQLAAGVAPLEAAASAVWLNHAAARRLGQAFIADDLATELSHVR